jgi:AraC-like DNA-binding protein
LTVIRENERIFSTLKKGDMFHVLAFNPHPLLRQCVDSYLIISVDRPEGGYVEHSFLPHTTQNLVFSLKPGSQVYDCLHSEFTARHFITGPNDQPRRVRLYDGMKNLVIHFKPGGMFKLFQLPAYYFYNKSRDANQFLGKQIQEIARQLSETGLSEKIELLDTWLIAHLQKERKTDRNIDEAIRLIERRKGNISIRELEQETFTTKRTLERRFQEQVGLQPKTFARLVRFNEVIRFVEANLNLKWRQLADKFGYYDQSHFIHEFKTLTGTVPHDFPTRQTRLEKFG